jgi:adenylate cyclase
MERRLSVILVADAVCYSRVMELDEAGTLAVIKAHHEDLIDPAIAEQLWFVKRQIIGGGVVAA